MSAIRLLQAERQEEIQHLHKQLMSGGILQRELWEEAEKFLIQREIYDVILAEEQDLREYKQSLLDSGNYTKKQVKEQSSALRKIRPKDYIFKGKNGGAYRVGTFRQEFQKYCDKNGIADGDYIFKSHDYRHTLATQFYDEDVSIQTIRDYLGHFSEEMTKQYVDFMPKRIEKASDTYFKKPENDLASTIKVKKRGDRK